MRKGRAAWRRIEAARLRVRFAALLDRIGRGEEVVITRHGKAIARLKELRAGSSLGEPVLAAFPRRRPGPKRARQQWRCALSREA